ncbi:unnamed protein product [Discosporangium mesarthrocarpum]
MKAFRQRRSEGWNLEEDEEWLEDPIAGEGNLQASRLSSGGYGKRRGNSVKNIILSSSEDRELGRGRIVNDDAVCNIRKKWISDRMIERQDSFCSYSAMTVFCGTYNVAGKKPDGEDLSEWLSQRNEPDLYAIGFQEIVDLNAVNVAVSDSKSQQRAALWRSELEQFLSTQRAMYRLVEQKTLVGITLFVYVQDRHMVAVRDVQVTAARVGVMGVMGNKGAASVRICIYDSTICFVCAHMAAKRSNVAGRNADFRSILSKTTFYGDPESAWEFRDLPCEFSRGPTTGGIGVLDHDIVFWLGDLNYRVSESLSVEEVLGKIGMEGGHEYLVEHDQLVIERSRGPGAAFAEFDEGPLTFPPTYKYQPGTELFERRPEKKLRAPAWCDRILWYSRDKGHVQLQRYDSARLCLSDHRPVNATLSIKIRQIGREQREDAFKKVTRVIHHLEEGPGIPELTLGLQSVSFGQVFFLQETTVVLHASNTGRGLAYIRFTPKLDEQQPWKRWLEVEPPFALLLPGDSIAFHVKAFVDRRTAREVCAGAEVLEDMLVLRLEKGAEHYIPVTAQYASPAFGRPLEELVSRGGQEATRLAIPHELWRLTGGMVRAGALGNPVVARGLFPPAEATPCHSCPDSNTVAVLRCLDTGDDFPSAIPAQALASAMLAFLSALPEPIVSASAMAAVETGLAAHATSASWGQRFLSALSPARHNTFLYVVAFLHEVAMAGRPAGLRPQTLAFSMSSALCFAEDGVGGLWGIGGAGGGGGGETSPPGSPNQARRSKGGEGKSWQHYQMIFRDILVFFISPPRREQ